MTGIPKCRATQVGGEGMRPDSHYGAPRQSTPWCRRTARHASAVRVHLPPAAVREARNFQSFFPLPLQEEEEEALGTEDEPKDEGCPEDFLEVGKEGHFAVCCSRVDWEKCSCLRAKIE